MPTPKRSQLLDNLTGGDGQLSNDEAGSFINTGVAVAGDVTGALTADPAHRGQATGKAIGGGVGAAAGALIGGPMGAEVGNMLGGAIGGLIGGGSDKKRAIADGTNTARKATLGIDLTSNINPYGQYGEGGAVDGPGDPSLKSKVFDDMSDSYMARLKQMSGYINRGSKDYTPKDYEDAITLNTGKYRNAKVPKVLISDAVAAAKKNGIDPYDLLALIGQESTFGVGYNSKLLDPKAEGQTRVTQQDMVTGNRLVPMPEMPSLYMADRKVPGVKAIRQNNGYDTEMIESESYPYLEAHPNILSDYATSLVKSADYTGAANYFDLAARHIKQNGFNKYNPGDKDYPNKIAQSKKLLMQDKNLSAYMKTAQFGEGGMVDGGGEGGKGGGTTPPPNRTLTPAEMQQWNGFIDFVQKQGYQGHQDLNTRNKNLGSSLFDQYKKASGATINYDIVPTVQQEMQKLQQNNVDFLKRRGESTDGMMDNLSAVDGWFGSKTSQFKFPSVVVQPYHNGEAGQAIDKGLLNSAGQTTGPMTTTGTGSTTTPKVNVMRGLVQNKDGDWIEKSVSSFEEGGAVDMAEDQQQQQAPQQPQPKTINVERGELLSDTEGNVLDRYMNPNRYSKHADNQYKEPQGNFVQADPNAIVVPSKLAKRFEQGDKLTRKSILRKLVDQQVQDPTINQPKGTDEPKGQYGDGGYIDPNYAAYMTNKLGITKPVTGNLPYEQKGFINPNLLPAGVTTSTTGTAPNLSDNYLTGETAIHEGADGIGTPMNMSTPAGEATTSGATAPKSKLDYGMVARRVGSKIPALYQMVNAMQGDPNLHKDYNHGFGPARAEIMATDDGYNTNDQIAAIDQDTALAMNMIGENNSPSARAEAAAVVSKAAEAKGQVMSGAVKYKSGVRNNMLAQLANLDVQQGASNQGEDIRYQTEKRMDQANDSNIMANALSENYRMDAGWQNDMEKIKMINSMSKFEDINPMDVARFTDDPHAVEYIYSELQKSRPLAEILNDLKSSRQVTEPTRRSTTKQSTTSTKTK